MDPDVSALLRLVQAGWSVQAVGDPTAPLLIYRHRLTDGTGIDEVVVKNSDDVRASRKISGTIVRQESGTATAVAEAVLTWPLVEPTGKAAS